MDLAELIHSRRSVSAFTGQPVPLDVIRDLLDTAVYAPNHRLTEPWRFILLTGEARHEYATLRGQLVVDGMEDAPEAARAQAAEGAYRKFIGIPLYLIVAMTRHENPEIDEENHAACACVIQNFLLLAWEQGIGTHWKTFKDDARLRAFAGLAPNEKVVGIIHVGYPAEEPRSGQRHPARERVTVLDGDTGH